MKVTRIELHPHGSSEYCVMSFKDPSRQNPYNVKGISGLDADDIVPRFYGAPGTQDFYNMMLTKRTIVSKVELNPRYHLNEEPSTLRDTLYRMISASRKSQIDVQFWNGETQVAHILGRFGKLEAAHFESVQEVLLTINCDEPMLTAPEPVMINVVGLDPSLTVIEDVVSTAPHGFKFQVTFTADVAAFHMSDPDDPDWEFEVIPLGGFDTGDVLHYSSEYNDKYLYIVRGGNTIHLADVITPGSVWPVMFPRPNKFTLADGPSLDWTSISYYPTFWGV